MPPNGIWFPFNPLNMFINIFKEPFTGCLGRSFERYIFSSCPGRCATILNELFFQDFPCHIPRSRLTSRNENRSLKFMRNLVQANSVVIVHMILLILLF